MQGRDKKHVRVRALSDLVTVAFYLCGGANVLGPKYCLAVESRAWSERHEIAWALTVHSMHGGSSQR